MPIDWSAGEGSAAWGLWDLQESEGTQQRMCLSVQEVPAPPKLKLRSGFPAKRKAREVPLGYLCVGMHAEKGTICPVESTRRADVVTSRLIGKFCTADCL